MMTRMSCGRAEKLMPLYAAGDLPQGRLCRAVAAHVAACATCAALAAEFRASREWALEAGAVPEFGEDFYERLRAGVLDEIGRDTRPAAPSRLAALFAAPFAGRRLAYAASLALAACALAVALYAFRGGRQDRRDVAFVPTPQPEPTAGAPREGSPTTARREHSHATPTPDVRTRERQHPAQDAPREDRRPVRDTAGGGGSYKRTPTLRHATPTNDAARAATLAANPPTPPAERDAVQVVAPAAAARAETARVSRIEIQTADPTIRIIWLSPGSGDDEADKGGGDPDK
jgi:hypothetical protein